MVFPNLYKEIMDSLSGARVTGLPLNASLLLEALQGAYDRGGAYDRDIVINLHSVEVYTAGGHIVADIFKETKEGIQIMVIPSKGAGYSAGDRTN